MTLYELQKEISNYYILKERLVYIVDKLNNAIDSLDLVIKDFSVAYSVNDESRSKNTFINQRDKLIDRRNLLQNKIIPEINVQIVKVKNQIENE